MNIRKSAIAALAAVSAVAMVAAVPAEAASYKKVSKSTDGYYRVAAKKSNLRITANSKYYAITRNSIKKNIAALDKAMKATSNKTLTFKSTDKKGVITLKVYGKKKQLNFTVKKNNKNTLNLNFNYKKAAKYSGDVTYNITNKDGAKFRLRLTNSGKKYGFTLYQGTAIKQAKQVASVRYDSKYTFILCRNLAGLKVTSVYAK